MGEPRLDIVASTAPSPSFAVTRAKNVAFRDVVMGYNHQVPHRGRVFHIQSEDSGPAKRHISTHVFFSGTIIASNRIGYDESTSVADISAMLRKSQKSMLLRLVRGLLDDGIDRYLGPKVVDSIPPRAAPAKQRPALEVVPSCPTEHRSKDAMDSVDLAALDEALGGLERDVPGTLGIALVDYESGACVGTIGSGVDLTIAAAGNTKVMKAQADLMCALGMESSLEDMLITLESQYHVLRPVNETLFLYIAIDRASGNLALARHKLSVAASALRP